MSKIVEINGKKYKEEIIHIPLEGERLIAADIEYSIFVDCNHMFRVEKNENAHAW
jgi:hypothetical protein